MLILDSNTKIVIISNTKIVIIFILEIKKESNMLEIQLILFKIHVLLLKQNILKSVNYFFFLFIYIQVGKLNSTFSKKKKKKLNSCYYLSKIFN